MLGRRTKPPWGGLREADTEADTDADAEASSEKKKNMLLCVRSGATFPVSPPESDVRRGKKKYYDTG